MPNPTHFGIWIVRTADFTYMATVAASRDCRFRCTACNAKCWGIQRLRDQTMWLCWGCIRKVEAGQTPGPTPFDTQPRRQLAIGERLRNPQGMWTVSKSQRIDKFQDGARDQGCLYVLIRDDGYVQTLRGRDMADFHLVLPAEQTTLI